MRSFEIQGVDKVLKDLDDNNELIEASLEFKMDETE
ncbi:hypothetical protein HNR33_000491 [Brassicibacter mesophilus]